MDKDKLIEQLKEQNKLLRAECKAAEEMDNALQKWLIDHKEQSYDRYTKRRDMWFAATATRLETEPPF